MRVLVVDDEPMLTTMVAAFVRGGGFEPTIANDGAEAWALFEDDPSKWSIMVTDIRMPGLDGVSLVERIRERGSELPVVFISGHGEPPDVDALAPAVFLAKPFRRDDLLDAMRSYVGDPST